MRRRTLSRISLSSAVISFGIIPALAIEPLTLKPSSKWFVNYGDDSCRLAREFGSDSAKQTLILERFGPGDTFNLALMGTAARANTDNSPARIRFGPVEAVQKIGYFMGDFGKGRPALLFRGSVRIAGANAAEIKQMRSLGPFEVKNFAAISTEREAAVTFLQISRTSGRSLILETGSLGKAFAALRKCTDDLMTTWGVNPEKYAKQSRAAMPDGSVGPWITDGDYPQQAIAARQRGIVNFRLSVDETGKPTACHIQQSTSAKDFDAAVCASLMRRAKVRPALDENGKPIASFYRSNVVFDMPTR